MSPPRTSPGCSAWNRTSGPARTRRPCRGPGVLADPDSGLVVPARGLTAIVCSAGDAVALSDRLGRYSDSGTTYDGRPLAALPLAGVRERILVTPGDAYLFAGPLRRELDPADRLASAASALTTICCGQAIDAAAARDIIEALPDQAGTSMAAGGREFSGGQQQRLRLARALMADPEVLILIDPTSAVDANTENKMAEGIARLRRGRATVVFTTSILLLNQADHVALVIDGTVAAEGSHESLMTDARYASPGGARDGHRMSALPVAANRELGAYARRVIRAHRAEFGLVVALQSLAAIAGLFVPWLLGNLVADVSAGHDTVPRTVTLIFGFLAVQAVLVRFAGYAAAFLGEKILAALREEFVADILALPPEIIEDADDGDLITRTTRDVDLLSNTVRAAIPATLRSVAVIGFTLGALALTSPRPAAAVPGPGAGTVRRDPLVPAAGAPGLPARGRFLLPADRWPGRDRRGRPDGRGAAADRAAGWTGSTRTSPRPTRPSATRCGCATSSSLSATSATPCRWPR